MKNKLTETDYLKKAEYKNRIYDFCGNYFNHYLKNNTNEKEKLHNFISILECEMESDETFKIDELYSNDDYQKTISNIIPVIKKITDSLVDENLDEALFYEELFKKVFDDLLFVSDLEKICAIVFLICEPKIPYFKLGEPLKMENEKYKEISNSIKSEISKAFFALKYGYTQKTELASQLFSIVDEQETDEKRIVLIANIIGFYNSQIRVLLKKIEELNNKANE